ncbi:MAG: class IV adenylate cyclase [Candidatus Acidiferrales bacterium]
MPKATNREVEIKLRVADLPSLLRRLRKLAVLSRGRTLEQNTLYDTPSSHFRRCGRLLRLRLETPAPLGSRPQCTRSRTILTSKAPPPRQKSDSPRPLYKERLERELVIRHPNRWPPLLRTLGLRPAFRYEKYRTTFELPALHLDLDETPAGVFLELEGTPEAIDHAARSLGFTPRDYLRITYWDVYVADCRRRGRTPRNMLFDAQKSRQILTLRLTNFPSALN